MAYKIQYAETTLRIDLKETKKKFVSPWYKRAVILFLTIVAVYLLQTDSVQECLIPGNKEITKSAWNQMTQSLDEGEPFAEAFRTFCQEVVGNGDPA